MPIINGTSIGGMTLQIEYSYTQNIAANTSTITATLKLVDHYALYATALGGSYIAIAGNKINYSKSISYSSTSATTTTVLATTEMVVSHNSDGTALCNLAGTFVMNGTYRGYSVGTMSVNSNVTLDRIPRSSTLTVPASINTGSTLSASITPSNGAFNHKVEFKIGSTVKATKTYTATNSTSAISVTQAVDHNWLPSSTGGTITVVLYTYSGTTLIATTSKNVTASVPASEAPSINTFTATSSVTTGTFANMYVQGKSAVKLAVTATAGAGSSIASYTYSGLGINSTTTTNTATTSTLQASGSQTYTVTVKDTRGRTASKTVSITVYPYAGPTISSVSVQRCDANGNITSDGTYAKYTVNSSYSPVNNKNTRTVTVAYSSNGGSSYSTETTLQAATDTTNTKTGVYGGGAFAITSAYVIRFTITDGYGATQNVTAPLQTAARPINIRSNGKGVAIGGMSTKDEFEVSMDADFNKKVTIDGVATVNNSINITGNIYMGGATGQTNQLALKFACPSTSANPHDVHLYGGNPSSQIAIGCQDARNNKSVWAYNDKTDALAVGSGSTAVSINGNSVANVIVEDGVIGDWYYRKWSNGQAECWGNIAITTAITSSIGSMYNVAIENIAFPSNLFIKKPLVFATPTTTSVLTVGVRGSTTTKSVFGLTLMYPIAYTNAIPWDISVEAKGLWK